MSSAVALEVLSVAKLGLEVLDRYERGELSDEELQEAWDEMRSAWNDSTELWERARKR